MDTVMLSFFSLFCALSVYSLYFQRQHLPVHGSTAGVTSDTISVTKRHVWSHQTWLPVQLSTLSALIVSKQE